jgi:hypothetical protein
MKFFFLINYILKKKNKDRYLGYHKIFDVSFREEKKRREGE